MTPLLLTLLLAAAPVPSALPTDVPLVRVEPPEHALEWPAASPAPVLEPRLHVEAAAPARIQTGSLAVTALVGGLSSMAVGTVGLVGAVGLAGGGLALAFTESGLGSGSGNVAASDGYLWGGLLGAGLVMGATALLEPVVMVLSESATAHMLDAPVNHPFLATGVSAGLRAASSGLVLAALSPQFGIGANALPGLSGSSGLVTVGCLGMAVLIEVVRPVAVAAVLTGAE